MQIQDDIHQCLRTLKDGGIILYPTDTVWGIGCDACNANAVAKIFALKKRQEAKSMIILVSSEAAISTYTQQADAVIFDYIKGVSKPTTIIYEAAQNLAPNLINEDGSIAIRIVKDEFCKQLIDAFGKPIVSTSANISGYPPPALFEDIDIQIKSGVDYIVQHRQNDTHPAQPSAIVKLEKDGSIKIIRS